MPSTKSKLPERKHCDDTVTFSRLANSLVRSYMAAKLRAVHSGMFTDNPLSTPNRAGKSRMNKVIVDKAENVPLLPIKRKNAYRNRPCLCGSGKKVKKCCWNKMGK